MEIRSLADAEGYLDGFINRERTAFFDYEKLGLERIRTLLSEIGDPQRGLPCLHIAGSKGKGSTSLAAEALLRAVGVRTAAFTQPHLESWRERFLIDGAPVAPDVLVAELRALQPVLERLRVDPELRPSFFDVTTALALALFRRARVDAAVIEVGLGGRIDSTNAVDSTVSVLTAVQLEHTDKLGNTLEAIAGEKAGIMRPGIPFLHGALEPEALAVVLARSAVLDAPLEEVVVSQVQADEKGVRFRLPDGRRLRSGVLGAHQAANLALAVRAVERFLGRELDPEVLAVLERLVLPARMERIGGAVLDCAHTPDSARALRLAIESVWGSRPWVLALSLSRDKDADAILAELATRARACVVAQAEPDRSWSAEELAPRVRAAGVEPVEVQPDPVAAVAAARERCRAGELLVVTGSVYFAGAVRRALLDSASAEAKETL